MKFYWNIGKLMYLLTVSVATPLQWQSQSCDRVHVAPKPKVFTLWFFIEQVCWPFNKNDKWKSRKKEEKWLEAFKISENETERWQWFPKNLSDSGTDQWRMTGDLTHPCPESVPISCMKKEWWSDINSLTNICNFLCGYTQLLKFSYFIFFYVYKVAFKY